MKVSEAISRAAAVYPELGVDSRAYDWLSELEERISNELSLTVFSKITSGDSERILLSPDYLSDVYPLYIVMKADLSNSDHSRYICHNTAFLSRYAELANYFVRKREVSSDNKYKF